MNTVSDSQAIRQTIPSAVIRFVGDSGDGIQLTGGQFTNTSARVGNDVATLPNYPSEIRAPAGSLFGVSGYQIQFGSTEVLTPGDEPDALVAFNPAALKKNLADLRHGGLLVVNEEAFTSRGLAKAHYEHSPLDDESLADYQVVRVKMNALVEAALSDSPLSKRDRARTKNFLALGLVYNVFGRPLEYTEAFLRAKFKKKPDLAEANIKVLRAGYNYGDIAEVIHHRFVVPPAIIAPGTYRSVTGNLAVALGLVAASRRSGLDLFLGSYPITPATDILQHLSGMREYGVRTLQAEDEIAGVASAVGASFAGNLAATTTSGPGLMLKSETLALATIVELPLVVVDVQRGGPSTGLPTRTEQSDLNIALFGRAGDSPTPVIAAHSPADCFTATLEAAQVAVKYRTPVLLLSDSYLANSSEPWRIPSEDSLPQIEPAFATEPEGFQPYSRDPDTLARPWAPPGTPGLEHRVGGLEKTNGSGEISHEPDNHALMVRLRAAKVQRIQQDMGPLSIYGDDAGGLLVLGWGSTHGAIRTAVAAAREAGAQVSHCHLRWLWPLHPDLKDALNRYDQVLAPELNNGQLNRLIRAELGIEVVGMHRPTSQPLSVTDLSKVIAELTTEEE